MMPFLAVGSLALEAIASQRDRDYDKDMIRCCGDPEKGALDRLGSSARPHREGVSN